MPTPEAGIRDAGSGGTRTGSGGAPSSGGASADSGKALVDGGRDGSSDARAKRSCAVPSVTTCPSPKPSYKKDVVPVLDAKCLSCHDGADAKGPWPLNDVDEIVHWSGPFIQDITSCSMPPPADGGTPLTLEESATLLGWLACGAPDN